VESVITFLLVFVVGSRNDELLKSRNMYQHDLLL